MEPSFSPKDLSEWGGRHGIAGMAQVEVLSQALARHVERSGKHHAVRMQSWLDDAMRAGRTATAEGSGSAGWSMWGEYLRDAFERAVLTLDVLRERGNNDLAHEAAGTPPVLVYDYEVIVDGKDLEQPVNYMLLRILPPEGKVVHAWKRPYVIIDPRAGHGAGIGGFKTDSQVGVALSDGHPVYFVAFRPHPEPGQTLASVTRAEAEFVRRVAKLHPEAPKPIIVGNCQGGWATMLLGATNPDITGPLVINGAPLAYWSGRVGENPMRYNGGLLGGVLPALVLSDLGHGVFDGAHLVSNFEMLNPARNFFGKYYDLYSEVDEAGERFLEFERWWGGFHFMNEAEIRWIVEQLFVGNRLARGEARLERGRQLDLKRIRSPIIVFASFGDNITPPQQALNWIVDTYADENEIRICGQRIIYMVHEKVGHLGIFVSSSIAKKEHSEVASTMKTIEALAPGLYEMTIDEQEGEGVDARFRVSFHERRLNDIRALDDGHRTEEAAFAAVDRFSHVSAEMYDLLVRPFIQAVVTPQSAKALQAAHPARVQRLAISDRNPFMAGFAGLANGVRQGRHALPPQHPLRQAERQWAGLIEHGLDMWRDWRDAAYELTFLSLYASPFMMFVGRDYNFGRTRKSQAELRALPEVQLILHNVSRGGYAEAVVRMLILLADARGTVRRSRLERSAHMLNHDEPFASLGSTGRADLIHEQSVIVEFEREAALAALPQLLPDAAERRRAMAAVENVAGPLEEMEPHTIHALQRFRSVLGLPSLELAGLGGSGAEAPAEQEQASAEPAEPAAPRRARKATAAE